MVVVEDDLGDHQATAEDAKAMAEAVAEVAAALRSGDMDAAAAAYLEQCELCSAARKECAEALDEAPGLLEKCKAAGSKVAQARCCQGACLVAYGAANYEEALSMSRKAAELFADVDDVPGEAQALIMNAQVRVAVSVGTSMARRNAEKASALLHGLGPGYEFDLMRAALALAQARVDCLKDQPVHLYAHLGWEAALDAAREAEELAKKLGDTTSAAFALCAAADVHLAAGQLHAAHRTCAGALALARDAGGDGLAVRVLLLGAEVALRLGKLQEARAGTVEAAAVAEAMGDETSVRDAAALLERLERAGAGDVAKQQEASPGVAIAAVVAATAATGAPDVAAPLADLVRRTLAAGPQVAARRRTPLMRTAGGARRAMPFRALGVEEVLALAGGGGPDASQAAAALSMLKRTEAMTESCRADRIPWEAAGTAGTPAGRARRVGAGVAGGPSGGAAATAGGAAWVAPVRKRMEAGVHWRPPDSRQGMRRFDVLHRRR